jgi:hypothetical protein
VAALMAVAQAPNEAQDHVASQMAETLIGFIHESLDLDHREVDVAAAGGQPRIRPGTRCARQSH